MKLRIFSLLTASTDNMADLSNTITSNSHDLTMEIQPHDLEVAKRVSGYSTAGKSAVIY